MSGAETFLGTSWVKPRCQVLCLGLTLLLAGSCAGATDRDLLWEIAPSHYRLGGLVGQRVENNAKRWLIPAPRNNPGLLQMFARRDLDEEPDLVPWAGEFVGKYLISGVQALRMLDDPRLQQTLSDVVEQLMTFQAGDGYLGPWPKAQRLRGHWDLWGHYHVMLALLMWHEQTGDERALRAAVRIGDLVCDTFLDTHSRVLDAGSPEMNMAIVHGLARLYQATGQSRYLAMSHEVVRDFEQAGDYYRTGLAGREFYRTPRPRWESLHSLQGLAELYRITGDASFRDAFLHHWASLRRWEMRNTGGFSSGEQATGNPFANDAIETCCVIAWQEVMLDALKLTGDPTIVDDLELSLFNAALGAQHPSGQWCTYNTPMDGRRLPSHVDIRFQARPDTPHLNCCSVNGPRGYGILSQWAVMRRSDGLTIHYWGPMEARLQLAEDLPVTLRVEGQYPVDGRVVCQIQTPQPRTFTLALRIPRWSQSTTLSVNGTPVEQVEPGRYCVLRRTWHNDTVRLTLDLGLRYETGDLQQAGKVSVYRGPLLLAADDRFQQLPPEAIALGQLAAAQLVPIDEPMRQRGGEAAPALMLDLPSLTTGSVRLIDFASAGATDRQGTPLSQYVTWLAAAQARPPRPVADRPADGSRFAAGAVRFSWRRTLVDPAAWHEVDICSSPTGEPVVQRHRIAAGNSLVVPQARIGELSVGVPYFWRVVAGNEVGTAESLLPLKQFVLDPTAPPAEWAIDRMRPHDQMVTEANLRGDPQPQYGRLVDAVGWSATAGPGGQAAIRRGNERSQRPTEISTDYFSRGRLHRGALAAAG